MFFSNGKCYVLRFPIKSAPYTSNTHEINLIYFLFTVGGNMTVNLAAIKSHDCLICKHDAQLEK